MELYHGAMKSPFRQPREHIRPDALGAACPKKKTLRDAYH